MAHKILNHAVNVYRRRLISSCYRCSTTGQRVYGLSMYVAGGGILSTFSGRAIFWEGESMNTVDTVFVQYEYWPTQTDKTQNDPIQKGKTVNNLLEATELMSLLRMEYGANLRYVDVVTRIFQGKFFSKDNEK